MIDDSRYSKFQIGGHLRVTQYLFSLARKSQRPVAEPFQPLPDNFPEIFEKWFRLV